MGFLFESIIEVLSTPLRNWEKLKDRYKIIFSSLVIMSIVGIIISIN